MIAVTERVDIFYRPYVKPLSWSIGLPQKLCQPTTKMASTN